MQVLEPEPPVKDPPELYVAVANPVVVAPEMYTIFPVRADEYAAAL